MKNLKNVITNAMMIVFGVLVFGFMAGSYVGSNSNYVSGYKFMNDIQQSIDFYKTIKTDVPAEMNLYVASSIIVLILVSLIIVIAAINLLINFNIIKSEKISKILNTLNIILSVLLLIFIILAAVSIMIIYKDAKSIKLGYGIIINIIIAVAALITSIVATVKSKKNA